MAAEKISQFYELQYNSDEDDDDDIETFTATYNPESHVDNTTTVVSVAPNFESSDEESLTDTAAISTNIVGVSEHKRPDEDSAGGDVESSIIIIDYVRKSVDVESRFSVIVSFYFLPI